MKRISTLFMLLAMGTVLFAAQISQQQALEQARSFINKMKNGNRALRRAPLNVEFQSVLPDQQLLYAFNIEDGGFVIVSGDDRTLPVLGYSMTGSIDADDMPDNMRSWLQSYAEQIAFLPTSTGTTQNVEDTSLPAVEPLLKTTWYQTKPYNMYTPIYGEEMSIAKWRGKQCPTGCVATAMAQVMNYHQWPQGPTTIIPEYTFYYTDKEPCTMPELPSTTFKWDQMLLHYDSINPGTEEQQKAVAELMLYCGQALKMDYNPDASGTQHEYVANALRRYFGYSKSIYVADRANYTINEWEKLLWNEVYNNRPVVFGGICSAGGHEFVIDGYDGKGMFHVNWGWAGRDDGYFAISVLNPYNNTSVGSSSDTSLGFVISQGAIIGMEKSTGTEVEVPEQLSSIYLMFDPSYYDNKLDYQPMYICFDNPHGHFYFGWGLKNDDGTITPILEKEPISIDYSDAKRQIFETDDIKLEDGSYIIWPIAKNADVENAEWQVIAGNNQYLKLDIKDAQVTVHHPYKLAILDAHFTNPDVAPLEYDTLVVVIENQDDKELSVVTTTGLGRLNKEGKFTNDAGDHLHPVELLPGERDTLKFEVIVPYKGDMEVRVMDYRGQYYFDKKTITVNKEPAFYDIELVDYRIEYLDPEHFTNCYFTIKNNDHRTFTSPFHFNYGFDTGDDSNGDSFSLTLKPGETANVNDDACGLNTWPIYYDEEPNDARIQLYVNYQTYYTIMLLDITVKYGTIVTSEGVTAVKGIPTVDGNRNTPYYDLLGRQLNGKPTQKGVYINQGRKVVNK